MAEAKNIIEALIDRGTTQEETWDIKLRWGGDWNMNFEVDDNKFDDFPHFELIKE